MNTLQIPAMSLRSARSSSSTTSSLESTFSDISAHASSSSSSSPPNAKTNAFFASPFSTRPPSPTLPASPPPTDKQPSKPRSLTADFFATPVRAPSPPASSRAPASAQTVHESRIFPSRYTSSLSDRRTPEFSLLEVEANPFHTHRTHVRNLSSSSSEGSSASASSSFTSSFPRARLPTPPPSPLHRENTIIPAQTPQQAASSSRVRLDDLVDNEPTPRPADREPVPMLRFERSLLLQRQAEAHRPPEPAPPAEDEESDTELESPEDYEPRPGNIIPLPEASQLPLSPLTLTFSIPANSRRSSTNDLRNRSGDDQGTPTPKNEDPSVTSSIVSPSSSFFPSPSTNVSSLHSVPLSLDDNHLRPASLSSSTSTSRGLPSPTASISSNSHDRTGAVDHGQSLFQQQQQQHLLQQQQQQQQKERAPRRKPQLRLLRSLGHGAFSAVWLAEDLSRVPLTLVSRRSVRDLRRMASGKEKNGDRERDRERKSGGSEQDGAAAASNAQGASRESKQSEREKAWTDLVTSKSNAPAPLSIPIIASPPAIPSPIVPVATTSIPTPPEAATPVAKSPRPPSKLRGLKNMLSFSRSPPATSPPSSATPSSAPTVVLPISPVSPANANTGAALPSLASPVVVSSPTSVHSPSVDAGGVPASSPSSVPPISSIPPSVSRTSSADSNASRASSTSSRLKWHLPVHPHAASAHHPGYNTYHHYASHPHSHPHPHAQTHSHSHPHPHPHSHLSHNTHLSYEYPGASDNSIQHVQHMLDMGAGEGEGEAEHGVLADGALLERDASLRKFRARVRGTRPPASLGRVYLDERDGEMGEPRTGGGGGGGSEKGEGMQVDGKGGDADGHGHGHAGRDRGPGTSTASSVTSTSSTTGASAAANMDVDSDIGLGASLSRNTSLRRTPSSSSSASPYGRLVAVKMTPRRPPRATPTEHRGSAPGAGKEGYPGSVGSVGSVGSGGSVGSVGGVGSAVKGGKGGRRGGAERARERQHRKEEEERTRVGFVREVEVLKHISHPNITPLLAHLSSATHHILVLPYLPGGDLLGLVNNDIAWGKLSESVMRRIWCELCKAVGWMHGVGLVHRDIKLENILLTAPTFSSLTAQSPVPTLDSLPPPPMPFIKLTDFGLSRFVEIDAHGDAELLSTRCGSEAYAAPELVTGGAGPGRGVYDARKTDAWACGVVLYALVGRQLPFGEGVTARAGIGAGGGSKIGGERGLGRGAGPGTPQERRHWLMRIARGEWQWPGDSDEEDAASSPVRAMAVDECEGELVGPQLVKCRGARRIVTRLLVRDPKKRARIADLWDDPWMCGGSTAPHVPVSLRDTHEPVYDAAQPVELATKTEPVAPADSEMRPDEKMHWDFDHSAQLVEADDHDVHFSDDPSIIEDSDDHTLDEEEDEDDVDEVDTDGCLFDQGGIDSITRQEVV